MKSTNDNRPLVEFSDIVKELHSYANSEQAVDDFASELLKIVNLQEEFDLSQSYFSDDKTNNYLRKKTNLKSIILSGINKSTSSFKNLRTDFVDTYQDYFDKNITGGNPFVNNLISIYTMISKRKGLLFMKEKFAIHLAVQRFIQEKIFLELMLIALKPYFQYLFLQKNKIRTYYS